ncbi:MAG: hypothetical protein M0R46_15385 [Candidatus Muirbacterium halophilum]|nr:hypothetical protein [Candidatus Muirbacterium halophilum]MCK9477298.1 hypothetical protein [Candidatus Muirbacterium halophilum]
MKKKILVIHPEGNIFNNPNLYEILVFLNKNYNVSVLIPKIEINQNNKDKKPPCKIIEYSNIYNEENLIFQSSMLIDFLERYLLYDYDFVIGVDRLGIYLTFVIHSIYGIKYGYISYEIFFEKESSKEFKKIEKHACENIEFAIVQDEQRGLNLHKENNIALDKMIYIPVAGSKKYKYKKNYFVYDVLNIEYSKKMLIYTGSIASWSCFELLFEQSTIPQDWVLVIHDRYGNSFDKLKKIVNTIPNNVYFLDIELTSNHDMHKILHSADLGLALYCTDFTSIYTGKNIGDLGLSSGKISTYLQNGLPIITTYNEMLLEHIANYDIGYMIKDIAQLDEILAHYINKKQYHDDCLALFDKVLSFNNYKNSLLLSIESALAYTKIEKKLCSLIKLERTGVNQFMTNRKKLEFLRKYNFLFSFIQKLNETYVIYGNGTIGKTIQALIADKVIGYVDMADEKHHPLNLKNMQYDKIIISVLGREEEIIKYLTQDLGVDINKIITLEI